MTPNRAISSVFTAAALLALAPATARADLPDDTGWEARREATLVELGAEYTHRDAYDNCVRFGFATKYLLADIDAGERGLGGRSIAEAEPEILHLAREARRLVGAPGDKGPCAWESAGSPAALHAAFALGLILHRWGDELSGETRDALVTALESDWRTSIGPYLVNGNLSIVAGQLLAGEALGTDSALWQAGRDNLEDIYAATMARGGLELNAPVYTAYQLGPLAGLMDLEDERVRGMAQILLEYELLVHGHLYLPGGGLGAPQSRDYAGGARDGSSTAMNRMIWQLTGDPAGLDSGHTVHQIGLAVSDWQPPPILRSIFLDKADGYEFWANTDAPIGGSRFPDSVYSFGEDGSNVSPWQAVVVPDAMIGIAHGHRFQSIHVSMGVYARAPDGSTPILYQYQPYVEGDTTETGGGMPSSGGDTDPDDFRRELYDHERLMVGRTMLSLWDPTLAGKDSGAVRTHQDTRVHLPSYEAAGGETRTGGGWYVARLEDTYVAYRPLGTIEAEDSRDGGAYTYLRLAGRSGGIVELATTDEFATLDDYLADLEGRELEFRTDPFEVSFEALDPDRGERVPVALAYRPERRWIDGVEISAAEALDHGLMDSPWVTWDRDAATLTVARDCYGGRRYDTEEVSIESLEPGPGCDGLDTTVFSPVPHLGDAASFEMAHPERWAVVEEDGDARLHLGAFDWAGERLGAHALARDRRRGDFTMELDVKTAHDPAERQNIDFAAIFGWQDDANYYYFLGNATAEYTALHAVEDGVRRDVAVADRSLLTDGDWHHVELSREGTEIVVAYDGEEILRARDDAFGEGAIGIGSLNDSVYFDNVALDAGEEPPPEDGSPPADDPTDGAGATPPPAGCGCRAGTGGTGTPVLALLLALAAARGVRTARSRRAARARR